MFANGFFLLLTLVQGAISVKQHKCSNGFQASDYIGERRVPINCKIEQRECPTSWKSGIQEGSETSGALTDPTFLTCHESFTLCGYVTIDTKSGQVLGQSGVKIGGGIDLGNKSKASFMSVPNTTVDKLEPYLGLKGDFAACAAIERPLELTLREAETLTNIIKNEVIDKVSKTYESSKRVNSLPFTSVPRGIRTALVSVWSQFGNPTAYPRLWEYVTKNDWTNAIRELRNFYKNPKEQARENMIRRNDEADIIEATLMECNRSVDVVFLIDESGSVSREGFKESLDFVKNITKAFSDNKLNGNDNTRFGLSTFSTSYKTHFYLSSHTNKSGYHSGIDDISYKGRRTYLGKALKRIKEDQFTEKRGLRPDVDGVPRILIVLTDGMAEDNVSKPAKELKDKNIVVHAIGIGKYIDHEQLEDIASSKSHVHLLSTFTDLEKFISTITSSTCYESRPVPLNQTIITNVAKDSYQYFSYKLNATSNLEININDVSGRTFIYASRTNPHPYKYDYDVSDISFKVPQQKRKAIVVSALPRTREERLTEEGIIQQIYVSVTSDTNSASFTLEGKECDPLNCTEATNKLFVTQSRTTNELPTTEPFTTNGLLARQQTFTTNELPSESRALAIENSSAGTLGATMFLSGLGMLITLFGACVF
jgi:uncharacterized protein YegL/GH24 family phage-related lysozyme (muramidase)